MEEEEKGGIGQFQVEPKKLENWEEQALHQASNANSVVDVKQENSASSYVYELSNEDFHQATEPAWSHQIMAAATSPKSCVTSFSSNMLDFSGNKADGKQPPPDRSSEVRGDKERKLKENDIYTQSLITIFLDIFGFPDS